ncbi:hypothetical protein BDZ91DRAFT_852617 [Kalaharituber pfeilii]|nr:hypothetical protein BDZ91DRAFT_852617 [Kalaharituber pfeilii]
MPSSSISPSSEPSPSSGEQPDSDAPTAIKSANSHPAPSVAPPSGASPRPPASRRHRTLTYLRSPTHDTSDTPARPTHPTSTTLPTIPTTKTTKQRPRGITNPSYLPLNIRNPHFATYAHLDHDGRIHISFKPLPRPREDRDGREDKGKREDHAGGVDAEGAEGSSYPPLSSLLDASLKRQFCINLLSNLLHTATPVLESVPPKLNIVIMVIGSRGDIQPFMRLAKVLVGDWGHRVRIATHPEFKEFVEEEFRGLEEEIEREEKEETGTEPRGSESEGCVQVDKESQGGKKQRIKGGKGEFFSVGGSPQELMAFMVKNPGLLPSLETIKAGEIARRREQMEVMFEGFWRACVEPSRYLLGGIQAEQNMHGKREKGVKDGKKHERKDAKKREKGKQGPFLERSSDCTPFVADAIIANPPSFAHIHCAERLGIPLHLMFTFPYTPTATMPHPLANVSQSNVEAAYTNLISYTMVEMTTWQGLGDLINRFRKKTLGLEPISTLWAPGLLARLKVPTTYLWSPSLIPKPADWGPHIDISGFVFLDKADGFKPPSELVEFMEKEPENPPVYIGFGSIVVDDPDSLTQLIFDAVNETGVRALVAKGWGGLGGEESTPKEVYMLDNTPHDWLFPKCRAVVHHGGAGTTAIGLKCGKPTFIVTFFGDQPFWGTMVNHAGAGDWCPFKELTKEKLVEGIKTIIAPETADRAKNLAEKIEKEGDGARNAVMSFYRGLETVGVTRMVGERGRKEKKRKERRQARTVEEMVGEGAKVGEENTTADVAAREREQKGEGEDTFGMEEEMRAGASMEQSQISGVKVGNGGEVGEEEGVPRCDWDEEVQGNGGTVTLGSGKNKDEEYNKEFIQECGIRCTILPEAVAVWRVRHTRIKLCALAAYILVSESKFTWKDLRLVRHTEWNDFEGPGEPLSGGAGAIATALGGVAKGLFGVPYTWYKGVKRIEEDLEVRGEDMNEVEECRWRERRGKNGNQESSGRSENSSSITGRGKDANRVCDPEGESDDCEVEKDPLCVDVLHGTTRSLISILRVGIRIPMDLSLAIAQGFHNAPRLYHDTVRRPNRITGLHSGLRAAGKEVALGLYDGVTGLVVKPYRGAQEKGMRGFVSGIGKGFGGVLFGIGAGLAGTIGYTLKGVHRELHRRDEREVVEGIRDMRVWQGEMEMVGLIGDGDEEGRRRKDEVVKRVLEGWEEQERREFEKKEDEAELKREISGVREIGWGAAKLRQLKKRAERKRKRRDKKERKRGRKGKGGEEEEGQGILREKTQEERRRMEVLGTGR